MVDFWEDDPADALPQEEEAYVSQPKAESPGESEDEALSPEEEAEIDRKLMQDVNSRLEVASLYKQFLDGALFDEVSVAASIVQRRIRSFVKGELQQFLGIAPRQQHVAQNVEYKSEFSENEVKVLKAIAAKVAKGETKLPQEGPQLRKLTSAPPEPQRTLQREQKPAAQPAPLPKPAPAQQPKKPTSSFQARKRALPPDELLEEAQDPATGARYKLERKNGRLIKSFFDSSGRPMLRPDRRPMVQDLTPQVMPSSAMPNPGPQGMAAAMERIANESVNSGVVNHTGATDKINAQLAQQLAGMARGN